MISQYDLAIVDLCMKSSCISDLPEHMQSALADRIAGRVNDKILYNLLDRLKDKDYSPEDRSQCWEIIKKLIFNQQSIGPDKDPVLTEFLNLREKKSDLATEFKILQQVAVKRTGILLTSSKDSPATQSTKPKNTIDQIWLRLSCPSILIKKKYIPRNKSPEILKEFNNCNYVALVGDPGTGKSIIAAQFIQKKDHIWLEVNDTLIEKFSFIVECFNKKATNLTDIEMINKAYENLNSIGREIFIVFVHANNRNQIKKFLPNIICDNLKFLIITNKLDPTHAKTIASLPISDFKNPDEMQIFIDNHLKVEEANTEQLKK